ncbi:Gfo/Idh/MocA family oxidoreductase [Actinomadura madurae]|uniref:Gfo/Idh/MocA family protein n=1 Tax=Actinomadura madurae TaxID=1993 RepID=UPI0020D22640|nr:Gfo/Idh/MocA family oxidoreductase [Actinomadura madurae]MCP9965648.1 Gfo/Idh/MocA family oxidoreductase [Actinomadura madurae]
MRAAAAAGVPVQVGFQRRFDAGNAAAREALASGRLGWLHTVRSCSFDPAPPPPGYVPSSGGLFRDCVIHDLDLIRFVTGREVVRVMAAGANRGDDFFREYGDVDTGSALLVLDDGTLGQVSATRYNAAGYDARLELFGSKDSIVTGLDGRTPVTALPERGGEPEPAYSGFMDRFSDAYDAELRAFVDVVAAAAPTRARRRTRWRRSTWPRRASCPCAKGGSSAPRRCGDEGRGRADLVGRVRGAGLGPPDEARTSARRDARRRPRRDRTGPRGVPSG